MRKNWFVVGLVSLLLTGIMAPTVLANGPVAGRAGRAEVRFLEGMSDHHQMAIDMANDCLAKASTDSLRTLCQKIIDAQSAEIKTMQGWLLSWYNIDYSPMPMNNMMGTSDQMGQMMSMMDMMMGMDMSVEMRTQMEQMRGMMDMMSGGAMSGMDMMSMMEQMRQMMTMMQNMDMSDEMRTQMEQMGGMMGGMMDSMMSGMSATQESGMMSGMSATQESEMNMGNTPVTDPPMMMGMMAGLNRLQGAEYDKAFIEAMIDHHDDAVHMSERILQRDPEGTGHQELRDMAQKIIDDQTAEIQEMENMLTQLGDS